MTTILHHQQLTLALRQVMGWPPYKPANDCIAWSCGKVCTFEDHLELGRIASMVGKDLVYSGWSSVTAAMPAHYTIAYRKVATIDIIDRVVPFAANDDDPVILVDARADQHFVIDERGSLVRRFGRPKALTQGHRRAMKRLKRVMRTKGDVVLPNNRWVPWGATVIDPDTTPTNIIVRVR